MANAQPFGPVFAGSRAARPSSGTRSRRSVVTVPGALGATGVTAGSQTEGQTLRHAVSVSRPYTDLPDRTNGKVFFTNNGGKNYVCSGTAVNSLNKSLVWTAGHCVEEGKSGNFHNNWVFVPGYGSSSSTRRPYGTWAAAELWTTRGWANKSNLHKDVGAAIVDPVDNVRLVDRVGGQGIRFNERRDRVYKAFGYPNASPFDGETQWRCRSRYKGGDDPPGKGPPTMKIHCDIGAGSSGGAWLTGIRSDGLGFVRSVNSYGYPSKPDRMFGPYLGGAAEDLFESVDDRTP